MVTLQTFFPDEISDQIFGKVAPYRARDRARGTFNHNDIYVRNGPRGALCKVGRQGSGYRATVDVGVAPA